MSSRLSLAVVCLFIASSAHAQSGPIVLTVDATRAPQKIIHSAMTIPVKPGPVTLYYPKWIPGEHSASGPIEELTGLKMSANGKELYWQRDTKDAFTFHVDVPQGASQLEVSFDFLERTDSSATEKLVVLEWNDNLLYPAGTRAEQLTFQTKLVMPQGWKFGTALPVESQSGDTVAFKPVALNRLVDSPLITGQYFRSIDLTPAGESVTHDIDIVADSADALEMSPEVQGAMKRLVVEAGKLFGARHYRDYHFLLTLSDHVAHFGLEHHESNDSRLPERTLMSSHAGVSLGGLLAHEYAHSWNGKFRRPADLSTPYYQEPEETDLLWVYEGLTDFAGPLLAARSGLWTPEEYRDYLAGIAAALGPGRPGRTWRPLIDTAIAEPVIGGRGAWQNWRRGVDYYDEGDLLWLEVATIIHDRTNGRKSIDDFCHLFHGGANNGPELKTYTFDDVVAALNQIAPHDWAAFLRGRITSTSADAPTGGIENAGWKLVFTAEPQKTTGRREIPADLYSVGLQLSSDGTVTDSIVGGPAFKAGIAPGMKVVAVDSHAYTHDRLEDAIKAAKDGSQPIALLVVNDEYYKTCNIDYHGGPRYPNLERATGKPDYLDELIKP
jgi:predicted metalloprotease with PDZ domain